MIKLVAIDLDGTLLNGQKKISKRNVETIKQAKNHGVKVIICTGRPLVSVRPILEELELEEEGDYAITFNGGMIQKNDTGEVLFQHSLNVADIKQIAKELEHLELPLDVLSNQQVYHVQPIPEQTPSIYQQFNPKMEFQHRILDDFDNQIDYNKVVVAVEDRDFLDEQIKKISEDLKNQYTFVKSRAQLLEILHKEVSKANALKNLGALLQIEADEMMALGDEENDLSMIQYAGLGIAMGNAVEQVKLYAEHITDTNEADGVAKAIERFVLEPIMIRNNEE